VGPYAVGLVRGVTGSFAGGMMFLALVMLVGAVVALLLRNARVLADSEG
jgi:MFS-type transporter involved in bile tolerance (Atg22 family)